jgi:hypothetical protein
MPAGVGMGTRIVSNHTRQVSHGVRSASSYSSSTQRARSSGCLSRAARTTAGLATGSTRTPNSRMAPGPATAGGQ